MSWVVRSLKLALGHAPKKVRTANKHLWMTVYGTFGLMVKIKLVLLKHENLEI